MSTDDGFDMEELTDLDIAYEQRKSATGIVEQLLRLGDYTGVVEACEQLHLRYPREQRFLALKGMAHNRLGQYPQARQTLLTALSIKSDDLILAEYINTLLDIGEITLALRTVNFFFEKVNETAQQYIIDKLTEIIAVRGIEIDDVRTKFKNIYAALHNKRASVKTKN